MVERRNKQSTLKSASTWAKHKKVYSREREQKCVEGFHGIWDTYGLL